MKWLPTPRFILWFQLAFAGVVLATFADLTFNSRLNGEPWRVLVTFGLGAAYFLLAHLWPMSSGRSDEIRFVRTYFTLQTTVVAATLLLSPARGFFAILALPLISQALFELSTRGACLIGAIIFSVTCGIWFESGGWSAVGRVGLSYIPGYLFTIAFTMLARTAFRERQKAERLSEELSLANEQLRARAAEAETLATIQERNRLAREIHDGVGHYLTVVKVQLDAADALLLQDPARAAASVRTAARLTGEALDDVRRSVGALAAESARLPLADTLRQLIVDASPAPAFQVAGTPRLVGAAIEHALFRTAQEGLTNLRKHARATAATLTLDYRDPTRIRLTLADNGRGPAAATAGKINGSGHGLRGLRERIALLGGTIVAEREPSGGFTLSAELPA